MTPLRLLPLALAACTRPVAEAPVGPGSSPFDVGQALRSGGSIPMPDSFRRARPGSPPPPPDTDLLSALGADLSGGVLDDSVGTAMVDALASEPPDDVEAWGAGTFTLDELFSSDYTGGEGLCEDPHAFFEFEEDGEDWELRLHLFSLLQLTSPLTAMFMELSETCADGVDAAKGDIDAAVASGACTEEEAHGFFAEDGACWACVQDSSVDDCLDAGECKDETPQVYAYDGEWYEWATADVLACAPDVPAKLFMAARDIEDDGTIPPAWNQTDWPLICFGIRDETSGEVELNFVGDSDGYEDITDGYGDGIIARIDHLREAGSSDTPHQDRVAYARRLSFADGTTTDQLILSFGGTGQISAPIVYLDGDGDGDIDDDDWGYGYGGWGWGPLELRPDGTDPNDINDTYARDWLAGVATKMATTRNGVPINDMTRSRCEEWAGPHEDGSYTCIAKGGPKLGYFMDNHLFWYNRDHTLIDARPLITLGSTGLPDEDVPGGITPHIAGTAALANPDWDDCTWPHQFVPDHIRTEDVPGDFYGIASLDADTYKFGKDPDQDIRMVLATTQERGYCPSEVEE